MKVNFHPSAILELKEAIYFYEKQSAGLGIAFLLEIKASLERIKQFPEGWAKTFKKCRRILTNRFPYGIVYKIGERAITIYAVMHLNRNPKYWADRIRGF